MGIIDGILGSITGSGIISAGAGLLGGLMGQKGQEETNLANAQQARDQMDFQERMSSTSYQRGVKDMEAAGLNPMLAYSQGGASTPGGAMATMGNPKLAAIQGAAAGLSTATQAAQIDNTKADTHLKEAQASETDQRRLTGISSAGHMDAMRDNIRQEMTAFETRLRKLGWETDQAESDAFIRRNDQFRSSTERNYTLQNVAAQAEKLANEARLVGLQVPEAVRYAQFWKSGAGAAKPYTDYGTETLQRVNPFKLHLRMPK